MTNTQSHSKKISPPMVNFGKLFGGVKKAVTGAAQAAHAAIVQVSSNPIAGAALKMAAQLLPPPFNVLVSKGSLVLGKAKEIISRWAEIKQNPMILLEIGGLPIEVLTKFLPKAITNVIPPDKLIKLAQNFGEYRNNPMLLAQDFMPAQVSAIAQLLHIANPLQTPNPLKRAEPPEEVFAGPTPHYAMDENEFEQFQV